MADTARSAASERDVSLLQTPSVPITLANLGQYLAELKRMMPPTPMVQVGLCACPWRGRFLCVLRCVVVLPCRSRCAACVAVPLPLPAPQVEFENITYTTKVPVREAHIPTVATALTGIASRPAMRTHAVLQVSDAHGCVRSTCGDRRRGRLRYDAHIDLQCCIGVMGRRAWGCAAAAVAVVVSPFERGSASSHMDMPS